MDEWSLRLSTRAQVDAIEEMKLGKWPEIDGFRKKWLPGGHSFANRDEARRWLEREAEVVNAAKVSSEESPEVSRFMADYKPEAMKNDDYPTPELIGRRGVRNILEIVFLFDDIDTFPFVVLARPYGFFAAVMELAERLAKQEGWSEHGARAWLITDDARPAVYAAKISEPRLLRHRKLVRVTIDVALDTPPHVLAAAFAEIRTKEEHRYQWPLTAKKPMAPWSLALVAFVVPRNDGRGWQFILEEWNATQPKDWRFENTDLLGRSAKKAYKTLMGRKMDWRGPRGAASHRR